MDRSRAKALGPDVAEQEAQRASEAGSGGGGGGVAIRSGAVELPIAAMTSSLTMRPPSPEPWTLERSTSFSRASLRTEGEVGEGASETAALGACFVFDDGVTSALPVSSISQIASPTATMSSSDARSCVTTPATGAGSSLSALSVRISTRGSSFATDCPTETSHLPIVPSTTLSPSCGMVTLVAIRART